MIPSLLVHVPKTAGVAIRSFMEGRVGRSNFTYGGHRPYWHERHHVGPEVYDRHYSFAFVRNPWDRAVSWYYGSLKSLPPVGLDEQIEDFRAWLPRRGAQLLAYGGHVRTLVADPMTLKTRVDFVGMYEHLDRDMFLLQRHLGIEDPAISIAPANVSERRPGDVPYQHFYDDFSRGFMEALGLWEIENFGYTFE